MPRERFAVWWLARHHAAAFLGFAVGRDQADRRLRLGGDLVFRRARAVPVGPEEAALLDILKPFKTMLGHVNCSFQITRTRCRFK